MTDKSLDRPVKGVLIRPNCTYEVLELKQLTDYQDAVGGWIEAVRLYSYEGVEVACGYVDEEGVIKRVPLNPLGSAISFLFGNNPYLAGNLIIVGKADSQGYDTDIPEYLIELVKTVCDGSEQETNV